jgi:uncharacterized protein
VIVAESAEPGYRRALKAYGVLSGIGVSKNIIVMTRKEVEWKAGVSSSLVSQAIRQGWVLYQMDTLEREGVDLGKVNLSSRYELVAL